MSHDIFLRKCEKLVVDPFGFDSDLANRSQSDCAGNVISPTISVDFGVPQGSMLEPLLFLILLMIFLSAYETASWCNMQTTPNWFSMAALMTFRTVKRGGGYFITV